jgi:hypothetical protein
MAPVVPPFPARGLLRRCRCGGAWRCKWELPKHRVKYNKPARLQYTPWGASCWGPFRNKKGKKDLNKHYRRTQGHHILCIYMIMGELLTLNNLLS